MKRKLKVRGALPLNEVISSFDGQNELCQLKKNGSDRHVKSFRLITRAGSSVLIIMTSILPKRGTVADSQNQSVGVCL